MHAFASKMCANMIKTRVFVIKMRTNMIKLCTIAITTYPNMIKVLANDIEINTNDKIKCAAPNRVDGSASD